MADNRRRREATEARSAAAGARFERLAADYFRFSYETRPTEATELGLEAYDDRLPDLGREALGGYGQELHRWAARFDAFAPDELPPESETDRQLIVSEVETARIWLEEIEDWKRDPSYYFEDALFAIFLTLSRRTHLSKEERAAAAAARLEQMPDLLAAGRRNLENPPRILIEIAVEELEGARTFCRGTIPAFAREVRSTRLRERLLGAARGADRARREYSAFLRHDLSLSAHGAAGIGRARFEKLLRSDHLLDDRTPRLRSQARAVFETTLEELRELAARIDPGQSWQHLLDQARQSHPAPARLLAAYRKELEQLRKFIRERDLLSLPGEECEVVETPPFDRALNGFAAYVGPGPFEPDQRGQFWVTPVGAGLSRAEQAELLAEHNNYLYPITAAHEAYPGHHVQLVRANQAGSRWRKHFASSLFAEGWALYCEQLMAEAGYFADPRTRLFQLRDRLWRAARVMGEIELHCGAATVEQVARFLVNEVGMSPTAARAETRRYAAEPTQPLSYLIGELHVLRLRRRFRALPLRTFHDMLLDSGSIPFKLVEREMEGKIGSGEGNRETALADERGKQRRMGSE